MISMMQLFRDTRNSGCTSRPARHDERVTAGLQMRPMSRSELDVLVGWAEHEGWNPGLHDADIFWATDPAGFVAGEVDGELVGGGSIVSYGGRFGFMGFFIVAPSHRGRGLGRRLWHHRKEALLARLDPGAPIGMDGVFAMQPFYALGGFAPAGRDLRFEGVGVAAAIPSGLVDAREVRFDALLEYDAAHFPAPRPAFLRRWIAQAGSRALAAVEGGAIRGYGVVRPCRRGFKIGPLFAADAGIAEDLLQGLGDHAAGEPLVIDAPEGNAAAVDLARRNGMREVFVCARMYLGPAPELPDHEIFGVTTFELG
jgi:GNAT superfamily N-acetyltransferase